MKITILILILHTFVYCNEYIDRYIKGDATCNELCFSLTYSKPTTKTKVVNKKKYRKNSCRRYAPYLKKYSDMYLGKSFPWWLLVAQDYQESRCRFVVSYDGVGSESPAQITWKWWKRYLKPYGIRNLKTIDNFTKAQVLIMRRLIRKAKKSGYSRLWIPFQAYNGGWLVLKEIIRTKLKNGILMQHDVRQNCRRRVIHFKNGTTRKACDINYDYPVQISTWMGKYYSDMIEKTPYIMW